MICTATPWALERASYVILYSEDAHHQIALALDAAKAEGIREAATLCADISAGYAGEHRSDPERGRQAAAVAKHCSLAVSALLPPEDKL